MNAREIPWSGRGHAYSQIDIDTAIEAMMRADPLTQGKYLDEFEKKFNDYLGVDHAFAVANGTNALDLATMLSGIESGEEVIIPAHTFCATAIPFARTGAKIVWADIDPETLIVSAETIKPHINPKTRGIVVVHLYGLMCDMEPIMNLASEHHLFVVEDCAQAIGADIKGKKAGTYGDFACFSFHGAPNAVAEARCQASPRRPGSSSAFNASSSQPDCQWCFRCGRGRKTCSILVLDSACDSAHISS